MENVRLRKDVLLEKVLANRDGHRSIFEEAVEGYKAETIRQLEAHLDAVRSGKVRRIVVSLPMPEDHTRDYDRAIQMIEMDTRDEIELSEYDFQSYVLDDWNWKRQFLTTNSAYSAGATRILESYDS